MSRLFEDFLSNKWNIYGLQVLAGSLMIMILYNFLTIFQMCIMGLCVYIIGFCQRLMGIRFGMLYYEFNKDSIGDILDRMRKIEKEEKKKETK